MTLGRTAEKSPRAIEFCAKDELQGSNPRLFASTMHDSFVNIKMEQHYGLHHEEDFGGGPALIAVTGDHSQHQSPSNEYGGFGFATSTHAHMDPIYDRSVQPAFSSPQSLHSLVTMPQWPSQITNPSESSPPASVPTHRPILPLSKTSPIPTINTAPLPAPAPIKPTHSSTTSRRTLSDSDRRRMCEYHNENPNVKQTEIGSKLAIL